MPDLVLAGKATEEARPWLDRLQRAPLAGRVRHIGYVNPANRQELYTGARLLVMPSFEEGFGLPVLEAMTFGVPVVASGRGSLPEVLGDAGTLVNPDDPIEIAGAITRMVEDPRASCARDRSTGNERRSWCTTYTGRLSLIDPLRAGGPTPDANRHRRAGNIRPLDWSGSLSDRIASRVGGRSACRTARIRSLFF
jgi:glycosyltransferase involved in cell wall biosynthesis